MKTVSRKSLVILTSMMIALVAIMMVAKGTIATSQIATGAPFGLPGVVSAEKTTGGTATIKWHFPHDQNIIDKYEIHRRNVTPTHVEAWTLLEEITEEDNHTDYHNHSFADRTIQANSTYDYRVAAHFTNEDEWFISNIVSITNTTPPTNAPAVPGAPTNLSSSVSTNSITLTWGEPSTNASAVSRYEIYRRAVNDDPGYTLRGSVPATDDETFTDSDVPSDVTYSFVVVAKNRHGHSEHEALPSVVAGLGAQYPDAPEDLKAVSRTFHNNPTYVETDITWKIPEARPGIIRPNVFQVFVGETLNNPDRISLSVVAVADIRLVSQQMHTTKFHHDDGHFHYFPNTQTVQFVSTDVLDPDIHESRIWVASYYSEEEQETAVFNLGGRFVPNTLRGARSVAVAFPADDPTYGFLANRGVPSIPAVIASSRLTKPSTPTWRGMYYDMLELDWNDITGATHYEVQMWDHFRQGYETWYTFPFANYEIIFDGSKARIRNLHRSGSPSFRVRAVSASGVSEWSDWVFAPYWTGTYEGERPAFEFEDSTPTPTPSPAPTSTPSPNS